MIKGFSFTVIFLFGHGSFIVINGTCGASGCMEGTEDSCPDRCLGGCEFNSTTNTTQCFACADGFLRTDEGGCLHGSCPANKLRSGFVISSFKKCGHQVVYNYEDEPFYCSSACPPMTGLYNNEECRIRCPNGYHVIKGQCAPVNGEGKKIKKVGHAENYLIKLRLKLFSLTLCTSRSFLFWNYFKKL